LEQLLARAAKDVKPEASHKRTPLESADLVKPPAVSSSAKTIERAAFSEREQRTPAVSTTKKKKESEPKPAPFPGIRESGKSKPADLLPSGLKMVTMLSLVVGLMLVLFYLFKKYILKNTPFGGTDKLVQVLGTGFLGPKKNIVLVEVAGEILVLGISDDNISLLTNIQDPEKIELIKNRGGSGLSQLSKTVSEIGTLKSEPSSISGKRAFSSYLRESTRPQTAKEKSVAEVSAQIRRNLRKLKTS
jgi:flagellar biosynthetic protein FliO